MKLFLSTLWIGIWVNSLSPFVFAETSPDKYGSYKKGACSEVWKACMPTRNEFWDCYKTILKGGKYPKIGPKISVSEGIVKECKKNFSFDENGNVELPSKGGNLPLVDSNKNTRSGNQDLGRASGKGRGGPSSGVPAPPPGSGLGSDSERAPTREQLNLPNAPEDQRRGGSPMPPAPPSGPNSPGVRNAPGGQVTSGGQNVPNTQGRGLPNSPPNKNDQEESTTSASSGGQDGSSLSRQSGEGYSRQQGAPAGGRERFAERESSSVDSEARSSSGTGQNADGAPEICPNGNCFRYIADRAVSLKSGDHYDVYEKMDDGTLQHRGKSAVKVGN